MKKVIFAFGQLLLIALLGFSSCDGDKKNKSTIKPDNTDTTKVITGVILGGLGREFSLDWLRKSNLSNQMTVLAQADPTFAQSGTSLHTMRLDTTYSKGYADNLEELVGTIIEINDATNPSSNFRLLRNITNDTIDLKTKIITPKYQDIIRTNYNKTNVKELAFMGIGGGISDIQIYKFEQMDIGSLTVPAKHLDTLKISNRYKCKTVTDCKYYVITSAVISKVETRLFTERTKKLAVSEFAGIGQAYGISGKLYTSSVTDDYRLKYIIFVHFRDVQSLLNY